LRDFSEHVRDADIAVVFYAGHGMEMNGVNYLIPVDATLARDVDVEDEAVSLDRVIRTLEPVRRLQLVILDSCRDNPFLRSMRRTVVSRSVRSGHGDIDEKTLPPNTLIAYAQKAGATADDGTGSNSPYTTALLKHLPAPGLDVELALRRVRDEVLQATRNRQEPFKYGSLGGAELPLVPAARPPSLTTTQNGLSTAEREWQQYAKDTKDIRLLEAFKEKHKDDPVYVRLAESRIEDLKKQTASSARPSEPAKPGLVPGLLKETIGVILPGGQPARCDGVEVLVGNQKRCLKPKDSFKDCDTCPEMVVVPPGQFTMGSPKIEEGRSDSENPQHSVTIATAFGVGRFAVTRPEFGAFVRDTNYALEDKCWTYDKEKWEERVGRSFRDPGFTQDDRHPVVCVSWNDAKSFVAWLSKKTAKRYRLLTEAEREYVTRAGTTTPFWWGTSISNAQANYDANYTYAGGVKGERRKGTVPVDTFTANSWGLHNMQGNVWEWGEDCWHENYNGAPQDGSAWLTGECSRRVIRGGSWVSAPGYLRASFRSSIVATDRRYAVGFRLARSLDN
jgi:formylglycine-generating enzyme required for sulfatase activity